MTQEEQTEQQQLNDLATRIARSTVAVIDTITTRGGFKGEELLTIGQLREQSIQVITLAERLQEV
jgi:hypothetical protein|tara:strand:- start:37730 stop:37924 length:195 start_codon:yes stop_codon:yes gene_type:complete